jgi:hypothetical protein
VRSTCIVAFRIFMLIIVLLSSILLIVFIVFFGVLIYTFSISKEHILTSLLSSIICRSVVIRLFIL